MNVFMFVAIWLFVPLATADAVSRERREGTLPLLYLTELGSWGIVVGKAFVYMLRSVSLFLAMAPWLLLPLVFGGVSTTDVELALLLDLASVLLAQAAGLVASTIPRDWLKSVLLAYIFAFLLLLMMLNIHGAILRHATMVGTKLTPGTSAFFMRFGTLYPFGNPWMNEMGKIARTRNLIELATNGEIHQTRWFNGLWQTAEESTWGQLWSCLTPAGRSYWLHGVMGMVMVAALVLLAATSIGAWRIEHSWREAPSEVLTSETRQKFLSPRFGTRTLRRRLSRSLTANPIGWLQFYSPSARMVKWAWCFFLVIVEIFFSKDSGDLYAAQGGLGLLLLLGLTFSATGSFRGELESGAFELLLVTPLRERQIIIGRVRGLWRQFLPAILVYGAGSIYLATGWSDKSIARDAWLALVRTIASFCTLPLIGLYFSLRRWNFFAAWLAASLIGLAPAELGRAFGVRELGIIAVQVGIALMAAVLLEMRLRNRKFLQRRS